VELHTRIDSFTKEVQQFVVSTSLEKEISRAGLAALNRKLDTTENELSTDLRASNDKLMRTVDHESRCVPAVYCRTKCVS
jgi:hypothetical protein